jgi:hypothetical protein
MSDDAQYRLTDEGIAISPSDEWHLATGELDVAHDLIHEDELSIVYGVPLREVRAWAGFMDVEPETMLVRRGTISHGPLRYAGNFRVTGTDGDCPA